MKSSPVDLDNTSPFSVNSKNAQYHLVSSKISNLTDEPIASRKVRKSDKYSRPDAQYIRYSVPQSQVGLDLSFKFPQDSSVFPRNIYNKSPFGSSISYLIHPRNVDWLYTYSPDPEDGKEKDKHTITASRFGYDRFYNEYGVGTQVFGFVEPLECNECANDVPKGMAPDRFYNAYHLKEQGRSEFRKYNNPRI